MPPLDLSNRFAYAFDRFKNKCFRVVAILYLTFHAGDHERRTRSLTLRPRPPC